MDKYKFNPKEAYDIIRRKWSQWSEAIGEKKWVVGISGGKDSTVVAALAARIFGKENVIGIMMPNGEQKDISDSIAVCEFLNIPNFTVNIKNCFGGIVQELENNFCNRIRVRELSYDTITNLPARLRMATLYAVAQTIGGIVLNTSNASENTVGFATLYGDHAGSYAPIQSLTVTEIRQLGDWLGLPHNLVHKVPVDGLQEKTDEDKLGFKYEDLDRYIREDVGTEEFKSKIDILYRKNRFKTNIVQIPGPNFDHLGNFVRYHNLPDLPAVNEEFRPKENPVMKYRDCINWSNNDHCAKYGRNCCVKNCSEYRSYK